MVDPETGNLIIIDWENAKLKADTIDKRIDSNAFFNGSTFKVEK